MARDATFLMIREADMIFKQIVLLLGLAFFAMAIPASAADAVTSNDIKVDVSKPYVVKQGDTLWDIANYFFKDPFKWLKIWEHNLQITNPDLIYPGNKIWFDGRQKQQQGGLTRVQPKPQIIIRPVQRMEAKVDSSLILTTLQRQGFIQPNQVQGVGYVLDSPDERLNYGINDHVYLKLDAPASIGSLFDIFRSTDVIHEPASQQAMGIIIKHMGVIKVTSQQDGVYRGTVVKAFEEISRGDRLKPAHDANLHIVPNYADHPIAGRLLYIRNDGREAGQNQVVGINLGLHEGLTDGMKMSIFKAGRLVQDKVSGGQVLLPQERIGELLVLKALPSGVSMALITQSTAPINIGDAVHSTKPQ